MANKQYLTFRLYDLQYGIESVLVQEIFPLPELTTIAEASAEVIGILDWQRQIVPVMHLGVLEGHPVQHCHLSDYVIIVQWEGLQIGIVVTQVNELLDLDTEDLATESFSELPSHINTMFIHGVATVNSEMIVLLSLERLFHQEALLNLIWDAQMQTNINQAESELSQTSFYDLYCSGITPKERAIFRQRAKSIRQPIDKLEVTKPISLMVIRFGNQYFGVNLELVQEIAYIRNLVPIPYSPKHILGYIQLRGEIITLVDIRHILHLPITPVTIGAMAVVVQMNNIVVAILVDEVLELSYINSADLKPLPTTTSTTNKLYLQGIAPFQEKVLIVLNLAKIFIEGELAVRK